MANQVSVTLTGRDELTNVIRRAQVALVSLRQIIAGFITIELGQILRDVTRRFIELARAVDGPVKDSFENFERILGTYSASVLEAAGVTDSLNRLSKNLASPSGGFNELAIQLTVLVELILDGINLLPKLLNVFGELAKVLSVIAVGPLGGAVSGLAQAIDEYNTAVAGSRERIQAQLDAIRQRREEEEALKRILDLEQERQNRISALVETSRFKNALTQDDIKQAVALLELELERINALMHGNTTIESRLNLLKRQEEIQKAIAEFSAPVEIAGLEVNVTSLADTVNQLISATKFYNDLTDETQVKLRTLLELQRADIAAKLLTVDALSEQAIGYRELLSAISDAIGAFAGEDPFKEEIEALAESIGTTIETTFEESIFTAFSRAFSGEGLSGLFKGFGSIILQGLGNVFVQMGQALIKFGAIMEKLKAFLFNIFTSGPAAIAAGVALIALGGALTGIATRVGTPANLSAPTSIAGGTLGQQSLTQTQGDATLVIQGGLLDMSDPRQANALAGAISELAGRRVILQGA